MAVYAFLAMLGVLVLAWIWATFSQRREIASRNADWQRYSKWKCPACHVEFGLDVEWVRYLEDSAVEVGDVLFTRHVICTCPHCRHASCLDPEGRSHLDLVFMAE